MRTIKSTDTTHTAEHGITLHYYGEDRGVVARYRVRKFDGAIEVVIGPARNYGEWIGPDDLVTVTKEKRYGEWNISISWSAWGSRRDADTVDRITDSFAIAQTWFDSLKGEAECTS